MKINEIINEETYQPPSIDTGDEIKVGKFKNRKAEVTGFKTDDNNQPVLKTTKGDQKLFKPRITKLMKEEDLTELDAQFVNSQVNTKEWKRLGQGLTATVWQHANDPDTVVKLVGGGMDDLRPGEKATALAFVNFCLVHGKKSKHFPKILQMNIEDPEVIQIRLEKLNPIAGAGLKGRLEYMASELKYGDGRESLVGIERILNQYGGVIRANNTAQSLIDATKMLIKYAGIYGDKFQVKRMMVDLHGANWMLRPNGVIVAVDPWYGYELEDYR